MTSMQEEPMNFDPETGEPRPYPSHVEQWRQLRGKAAWLFNPWTGERRDAYDVGNDVHGTRIVPPVKLATGKLAQSGAGGSMKQQKGEVK